MCYLHVGLINYLVLLVGVVDKNKQFSVFLCCCFFQSREAQVCFRGYDSEQWFIQGIFSTDVKHNRSRGPAVWWDQIWNNEVLVKLHLLLWRPSLTKLRCDVIQRSKIDSFSTFPLLSASSVFYLHPSPHVFLSPPFPFPPLRLSRSLSLCFLPFILGLSLSPFAQ